MTTVVVYYDEYHTPLDDVAKKIETRSLVMFAQLSTIDTSVDVPVPNGWSATRMDLRGRFCDEILSRAVKANARYEEGYFLSAALSRPLLALAAAETMATFQTTNVVHGFAGNDQLRFEAALKALLPEATIQSVADLIGSRTPATNGTPVVNENIWGRSVESGPLRDPWYEPQDQMIPIGASSVNAVRSQVTITFKRGIPVALDGEGANLIDIVDRLNVFGKEHGAGWADLVEDGYVGLKSRALYVHPAAEILIRAHADLERFVSSPRQNEFKSLVDSSWSRLVYEGAWFDPQRTALDAYIDAINDWVSGDVRIAVGVGGIQVIGRRSPYSLYDEAAAIYHVGQDFGSDLIRGLRDQIAKRTILARARDKVKICGD